MLRVLRVGLRKVEYTLISSRVRASVLLQALPEGKIRLYVPAGMPLREADKTVRDHLAEIDRAHAEFAHAAVSLPDTVLYEGKRLRLCTRQGGANRVTAGEDTLFVTAANTDAAAVREQLKRWLVKRALERIRENLDTWSPTVGKPFGRVTIREQHSRWGSCSSKQNLNFNWKLILAPPEALTYVVIHELCHLLYFNHSPQFWGEVEKRMPDYKIWKNWLKLHGSELTL